MPQERKYIIMRVGFITLIVILLIVIFIAQIRKPKDVIREKIGLALPSPVKVMGFNNNIMTRGFEAKLEVNDRNLEELKRLFLNVLNKNLSSRVKMKYQILKTLIHGGIWIKVKLKIVTIMWLSETGTFFHLLKPVKYGHLSLKQMTECIICIFPMNNVLLKQQLA